ncbi:hypothetical protein VTN96DRAFT_2746 [Rasamsonia emersonii]
MPALKLTLRPAFNDAGAAQAIDVRMVFDTAAKTRDEVLFDHALKRAVVPTTQYTAESVRLTDGHGYAIALHTTDTRRNTHREFRVGRDVAAGEVLTVEYRATPREVDESTPCGPQVALERETCGLSGAGLGFLLIPVTPEDVLYDITIEWDLSYAPAGTRAVCTFGEGPHVAVREKVAVLAECFFAVGQLKSYPNVTTNNSFGLYWLAEPPFDARALGEQLERLVPRMAAFFHDDEQLFRIFVRRNEYKCASGRGLYRGFVFAWTPIFPKDADTVQGFLLHEIVHNWPRLGFTTGGPEDLVDSWFNEGIAEYYSLILPYRFGIFSEEEFVQRFNWRLSGYYTNPDRAVPNRDVQDRFWLPGRVNRIPYQRGLMYFLQLACQLHREGKRSLDDLILEMIRLRAAGQPHGIKVWLSLVEKELGPAAWDDYRDMSDAKPIVLLPDVASTWIPDAKWTLQREDQEEFYLGFPEENLSAQPAVIRGLDPQSRAAEAGLREGDMVTSKYSFLSDADGWNRSFTMYVKRGGEEVKISWWPRSWTKVPSYQFVRCD